MPNLNMNNFQTRNRTFDPDPLPYICAIVNSHDMRSDKFT